VSLIGPLAVAPVVLDDIGAAVVVDAAGAPMAVLLLAMPPLAMAVSAGAAVVEAAGGVFAGVVSSASWPLQPEIASSAPPRSSAAATGVMLKD
jgi:hypothetical protein